MSDTLNEDLNIMQSLSDAELLAALSMDDDMTIIGKLGDEPNEEDGLTADQLKAKFDEAGLTIQAYINNTLVPKVVAAKQTEDQRSAAETARRNAEASRKIAEAERQSAETARAAAEAQRAEMVQTAVQAAQEAQTAASHGPYIGANGHWMVWNSVSGAYQDSGVAAKGESGAPHREARLTVGTSVSGWTAADCDYLCDGIDDQTELNAAIAALPDGGGEVVILDGVYHLAGSVTVSKDNVTLRGNGPATKLTCAAAGTPTVRVTAKQFTLRDMQVCGKAGYAVKINGDLAGVINCQLCADTDGALMLCGKGSRVIGNLCRGQAGDIAMIGAGSVAMGNVTTHPIAPLVEEKPLTEDKVTWSDFMSAAWEYTMNYDPTLMDGLFPTSYDQTLLNEDFLLRKSGDKDDVYTSYTEFYDGSWSDTLYNVTSLFFAVDRAADFSTDGHSFDVATPSWYEFQYMIIHYNEIYLSSHLPTLEEIKAECKASWGWKYEDLETGMGDNAVLPESEAE